VSLEDGIVMVVTDLHGDWSLYRRYRDVFLHLQARGLVDRLLFTGDLVHSDGPPEEDGSLDIILDLIQLQETLGELLLVLLGNHEMPHIYHVPLIRGERVYTPLFEAVMGEHRDEVLRFFQERPFFVRTKSGVAVCHAGAFPESMQPGALATLETFSHQRLLARVERQLPHGERAALRDRVGELTGIPYAEWASAYLAVDDESDPRYDDYLRGIFAGYEPDFKLLWSALFSRNELETGIEAYNQEVRALLDQLGRDTWPQHMLVTGHIGCRGGYRILPGGMQMRVASGAHAHPYASARYLLFDAGKRATSAEALLSGLGSVFSSQAARSNAGADACP
jgi:hypothetical protein